MRTSNAHNDRAFLAWLSACIETHREVNLDAETAFAAMPFRDAARLVGKKLGLTMTCKALESPPYKSRS